MRNKVVLENLLNLLYIKLLAKRQAHESGHKAPNIIHVHEVIL